MATNPVHPPASAVPTPHADAHYDEHSGVYGFFRRHQKKLLYTAGLFVLLTFSITGPMSALARELFSSARAMPTIVVNGARIALHQEDLDIGNQLAHSVRTSIPRGVLPMIDAGEGNQNELGFVLAVLRRAAVAEGIAASFVEVDKAIETLRQLAKAESAAKMARDMSYASLSQYRTLVAEAMRVGTYVRLQTLALDSTEARVLAQVTSDREKITLRVASFDEKKAEEDLKKASPLSEEDLHKWLDGKSERDKRMMQAYDAPRAQLHFGALLLADDQFDPEQWKDSHLKDFTVSDEQLQNVYNQEKENRFKLEGVGQYKPLDEVKPQLTRLIQAEHVMNQVMAALRQKQTDFLKPQSDEVAKTHAAFGEASTAQAELDQKFAAKTAELDSKEKELAQKPDDPELAKAVATLKTEVQAAKDASFQAGEKIPALKTAMTEAEKQVTEARAKFDFKGQFEEVTKDKKGFVTKSMAALKTGDEMKDLDAPGLELGLGKWPMASQGAGLRNKGDLGFAPGRTEKAVVLYQAIDVEPLPLKPWETLKPLAEGAYWTEQAKKQGEEKKKLMEEALLRLAKAKMPDKVAEIEGGKQKRVDDKVAEWEKKTNDAIAAAIDQIGRLQAGTQAIGVWKGELDKQKAELAQKEARKTGFEAEVKKAIEDEIATEAKKFHKDVLDAAAAEAGFTVADLGPFARDLQQLDPRFDKNNPPPVVFLWRSQAKLKEGETTGVLQDFSNRAWHVAVCTKVEPLAASDVTRRDFESLRTGNGGMSFANQQAGWAYRQAFTLKAVETRYDLKRDAGELREEASAPKKN